MKAYLVIVFMLPGHSISTQSLPMETAEGCQAQSLEVQQLPQTPPEQIAVRSVIFQSICIENK
jgi:hypothetical protein